MGRSAKQKKRNLILVFIILLIAVLSLFILREVSRRNIFKEVLENSLGKVLQKDVKLIGAKIVFYPEFTVEAIGATINGTDDSPPITIKKLSLSIDLTELFRGKPTIGELTVTEPTLFLEIGTSTKLPLIDPFQMEKNLGITKFFVRKININGGHLFIKDHTTKDSPLDLEFNGIKLALESSLFRKGISFKFVSDMVHDDTISKLKVKGRVAVPKTSDSIKNAFWIIEGDFTSLDTTIFVNYLNQLPNLKIPKGTLNGDFNYRGSLSSTFSLFGYIESSDIEIIYPPYYREPLQPDKAKVFINILHEKELLNIREFEVGIDEALFAGNLKISSPRLGERTISGHLKSHWFPLPWLRQYLPKGEPGFSNLSNLLEKYVRKGRGKIKNAAFYGNIKDFSNPFSSDKKPINLEIALRDLDLKLKESAAPLSNVSGEFQLEGSQVSLTDFNGMFGNVPIKKLAGNISGITTPSPQVNVAFNSSLNFSELEPLLASPMLPEVWKKRLNSFSDWEGDE